MVILGLGVSTDIQWGASGSTCQYFRKSTLECTHKGQTLLPCWEEDGPDPRKFFPRKTFQQVSVSTKETEAGRLLRSRSTDGVQDSQGYIKTPCFGRGKKKMHEVNGFCMLGFPALFSMTIENMLPSSLVKNHK